MSTHNRNPSGKNQHAHDADFEDQLAVGLRRYHREAKTDNKEIAALLLADYKITTSASTVKRRRKALGLSGGGATVKKMAKADAVQLVLNKVDKDPAKRAGVRTIRATVAFEDGVILTRQVIETVNFAPTMIFNLACRQIVWEIMQDHDGDSFALREPTAKKVFRVAKFPIGINQRWAMDGHDKLYKIGFPVYAIVDDATGKILKASVVPSNRFGEIVCYRFLCLVEELGGMPIQTTTDCGSETTLLFGVVNTLRHQFHPEIDSVEVPPHVYLRSVHNISVERQWLRLRLDFGDNCVLTFNKGTEDLKYNSNDPDQYELCQWLWPRFIQTGLDDYAARRNIIKMRKQSDKPGPSAMSRNTAYSLPETWGGRQCLQPVDIDVIRQMKLDMGGDALIAFSTPQFAARAQLAYDALGIQKLEQGNIWDVFRDMLPLVFPGRVLRSRTFSVSWLVSP
ncbi:hypothetical protein C8F04DRAFT_972311 [Mycena alexandri]|uniref:Integrase core domain-containing protein n=1 Tax=Mycena alexandri TaxID=1745969 RepID=A0AAD6WQW1_9AGAR|nr:hypothetical protein C8F04DRAFT_972311 [Mycena alexandri]